MTRCHELGQGNVAIGTLGEAGGLEPAYLPEHRPADALQVPAGPARGAMGRAL